MALDTYGYAVLVLTIVSYCSAASWMNSICDMQYYQVQNKWEYFAKMAGSCFVEVNVWGIKR